MLEANLPRIDPRVGPPLVRPRFNRRNFSRLIANPLSLLAEVLLTLVRCCVCAVSRNAFRCGHFGVWVCVCGLSCKGCPCSCSFRFSDACPPWNNAHMASDLLNSWPAFGSISGFDLFCGFTQSRFINPMFYLSPSD